jgi:hypothetical protein
LYIEYDDIRNPLQFSIDTILKEAKEESRLVKQILYTMLSAYTNNPINLAINSPSGEGKTYVLQKVGELFPKQDAMFLAGMTEKALFHRSGVLVIKNEVGEYQSIEDKSEQIDSEIEDKEYERAGTKDRNLKQGLQSQINDLKREKKELLKDAKKLIDLSHKILVFLDSPRPELFNALMPLLSHDRYEVEYEFVDTNNGIKTKSNILRGWPAVIFAQAIDYSHYQRYPEIQRRFIITNPKMETSKYAAAVDLICDKFGLPDFAYQSKIVSDSDKERACQIIKGIKERITEICACVAPGKSNVVIPYYECLKKSLSKQKAFDMTVANRFLGFLSLLPIINTDNRPRLIISNKAQLTVQTIPFALFEDLRESMDLMQYANGVRPYILEWYNEVFLVAFSAKTEIDSKTNSRGEEVKEKRVALTSRELIDKTYDLRNKKLSTKQMLQNYITPLLNENYVDSIDSELDKRAHIYFPVLESSKSSKLFLSDERNNILHQSRLSISDSTLYPDKPYIISKIEEVLGYSSDKQVFVEIKNHEGNDITSEDIASQYYGDHGDYFESPSRDGPQEEYLEKCKIANESYDNKPEHIKSIESHQEPSRNVFLLNERNNFIYSCYHNGCDFRTIDEKDYHRHAAQKHTGIPVLYPTKAELEKYGLKAQGKSWEI